ncbi:MAG: hypothetical protein QW254_03710, partial [Desulfurococcaceae archaeon]
MCIHHVYTCVDALFKNNTGITTIQVSGGMNYRKITSSLIILAFILPLIPLALLMPVHAQGQVLQIPDNVYPGETLTVTVEVYSATVVRVVVANKTGTYTYAEQVKYTAGPGNVTFNIPIPKKLPYLTNKSGDQPALNVTVYVGGTKIGEKVVKVYPVIEVSPTTTTVVDPVTGE